MRALSRLQEKDSLYGKQPIKNCQEGQQMAVIPDAWLDFHVQQKARMSIVLELDRGTEEEKQWKRKLRALLKYAEGQYQAFFGSESLSIAFATTAGSQRLSPMKAWTEQVLKQQQAEADADLFVLTTLPDGDLDPKTLFLGQVWEQPFEAQPVALLSA